MLKDLTPRERLVLARIMMKPIMITLDERDFGRWNAVAEDPTMRYVHPHIGVSGGTLLDKYLAKVSPTRRQWLDENCEYIILAGSTDIKPSEIPYYRNLAQMMRAKNGGSLLTYGRRIKEVGRKQDQPTKQVDGKDQHVKPKK